MPDANNPFLIPPPPPGMPSVAPQPADSDAVRTQPPTIAPPASLITGTSKVTPSTAPAEPTPVVFFPAMPGTAPSVGAGWHLLLADGSEVAVSKAVFIGRDPARTPDRPGAELRAISDPARSLSKTHALLELDGGALWVHDLNSTNGVVVAAPGTEPLIVEIGVRAALSPGAELRLGSYVIRVRQA